jgi:predicted nucleotidyltransferase
MGPSQAALLERFTAACLADPRVSAAFLGGSWAAGTADAYSDLDLYAVVETEAYQAFFADRERFMRALGDLALWDDFSEFGFDMIIFVYADGVDGELALAPVSAFQHIHGGSYRVLVDKRDILRGIEFPYYAPGPEERSRSLQHAADWFWRELPRCAKALARGRLWTAAIYVETLRRHVRVLLHELHPSPAAGDLRRRATPQERVQIDDSYVRLDAGEMARAVRSLMTAAGQAARTLADEGRLRYPEALERAVTPTVNALLERVSGD